MDRTFLFISNLWNAFIHYFLTFPFKCSHFQPFNPEVRKCHDFLMSNAGICTANNFYPSECQQNANSEKFANDFVQLFVIRLLRRSPEKCRHFIECKDTHFSQISQVFLGKSVFTKILRRAQSDTNR